MLPNGGGGNRPSASRSTMTRRSEFDFSPHEKPSPFLGVVKVVIMLVNVAFMMVAGMLIYFTAWIQSLGLVAMFGSNYSWLSTAMFGVVLAFGVLVITTSLVGCLGAWAKNRHMLLGYMFVQTINLVVFVVIAVGGFLTRRMAHSLQASATPRHEEASFPMHFNPLYCQSQVAYYCSAGSVSESLTLFLGPSVAAKARGVFDQLYGLEPTSQCYMRFMREISRRQVQRVLDDYSGHMPAHTRHGQVVRCIPDHREHELQQRKLHTLRRV
ncbi:hypothetical protein, variant 3 [Aphanomyces invadans]|uniref:Uncharacterized protein n=1 Tax=Aphanomyces invadans TaxID=157072 RepID=A0A024UJB6_9STRA|nr:hypothetical protein, variant 3 [Aphanomyces invadans]XP_008865699.1 hypothetical protein, variant 2 [Aphanomyces invadans]ETW05921.1 hypothetical protein, variant 2 [Aphanomyces invadans]ETW05922.1 hypothetical protein, variant 3 [Aphanomyces invadans]|eukprot:XP_008865698.1 hypothetical protein, variant 3 [Aphanomyces invadans]